MIITLFLTPWKTVTLKNIARKNSRQDGQFECSISVSGQCPVDDGVPVGHRNLKPTLDHDKIDFATLFNARKKQILREKMSECLAVKVLEAQEGFNAVMVPRDQTQG